MTEPEGITVPDEIEALFLETCKKTSLGKGRLFSAALFFLADQLDLGNPAAKAVIEQWKEDRSFRDAMTDILENARLGK